MINKITLGNQPIRSTKTEKVVKKQKAEPEKQDNAQSDSLVEQIVSQLKLSDKANVEDIRREFIVKTLTGALGENASRSASFKKLVEQVESALSDNVAATQKLNDIKSSNT